MVRCAALLSFLKIHVLGGADNLRNGEAMLDEGITQQHDKVLEAALDYAITRKWHVFPWNCLECWAFERAANHNGRRWGMSADPEIIRQFWLKYPHASLGIATGQESGFWVLETDTKAGGHSHDGAASLAELEAEYGELPGTLQAESPSGSVHYYFRHSGLHIKSSAGKLGPGIDVKGDGGMVVGVPSLKPTGVYKWRNNLPIAAAPQWLLDLVTVKEKEPEDENEPQQAPFEAPHFDGDNSRKSRKKYAKKVKQTLFDRLSRTEQGGRNDELNKCAFLLGKLVAAGVLRSGPVESDLFQASQINGYVRDKGISKTKATIQSGFGSGIKQPWIFHHEWRSNGAEHSGNHQNKPHRASGNGAWPFEAAKDFRTDFNRNWIIKGILAPGEVSNWVGPPGAGKSSLVGDLALHVTASRDWRGHLSKKTGSIVYFALERSDLVKRRFNAQAAQYGLDPKKLHFHVVDAPIDMMGDYCVNRFVATIRAVEEACGVSVIMIVIDTSSKAIAHGGGSENEARDKNIMRANGRKVMSIIKDLHVALVGHVGKNIELGERGSNAGLGDDDVQILLNKTVATVIKRNDGPDGLLTNYRLISVEVGIDEDGEEISIAIVDPDDSPQLVPDDDKIKGQPGLALRFLIECVNEHGTPPPARLNLPRSVTRVVLFTQWEEHCQMRGLAKGSARTSAQTAFSRASDKLLSMNAIAITEDWVWIVYKDTTVAGCHMSQTSK
jgi:hypothetical protein